MADGRTHTGLRMRRAWRYVTTKRLSWVDFVIILLLVQVLRAVTST